LNNVESSNDKSLVLFLIGPSGVGKSSVLKELYDREAIELTPSWTTRPPRAEEKKGSIEHRFITNEEFSKLEKNRFFLETFQLFNLPYRFGLPRILKPAKGKVPALVLRTYLLPVMKQHYPHAITYAIEDEFSKVEKRLHKRKVEGEPLGSRLLEYKEEIRLGKELANKIFSNNSSIELLADQLQRAIAEDFA
jgi:guanylate kinase